MEYKNQEKEKLLFLELDDSVDPTSSDLMPEKKLRFAIIERAILDWLGKDKTQKRSAKEWFTAPVVENPDLHTFQNVCYALDLDVEKMRKAIILYIERKKSDPT